MDIFDEKNIAPMLIGETGEAFDSADFVHELKLDGIRCIAYLGDGKAELRNKRNLRVTHIYPELLEIYRQVNGRCILDGEVFVMMDGKPYFAEMQRRALMSDKFKITLAADKFPVTFTAFDILYKDGEQIINLPLMQRKEILSSVVSESGRLSVSRYIDTQGIALCKLTEAQGLEGIVSKRKNSKYRFGIRTKDWIKVKNLLDDDFVVCGYIEKEKSVVSIVLGQYAEDTLVYKGHVTLGVSGHDFAAIRAQRRSYAHPFPDLPKGNESAIWIAPDLVCTVKFMERTSNGSMRQPVFKGLRDDKLPKACRVFS